MAASARVGHAKLTGKEGKQDLPKVQRRGLQYIRPSQRRDMNKDVGAPASVWLEEAIPLDRVEPLIVPKTRSRRLSAYFIETALVIDGSRDPIASRRFDEFFKEANISVEPVTLEQARLARQAYRDFGKGSGHPAKLKFGDCFAYA